MIRRGILLLLPAAAWQPASLAPRRGASVAVRSAPDPSPPAPEPSASLADALELDAAEWSLAEDWDVRDCARAYTAGTDEHARTFWSQLAAATPSLARRSAEAIEARHRALTGRANPPPPLTTGCRNSSKVIISRALPSAGDAPKLSHRFCLLLNTLHHNCIDDSCPPITRARREDPSRRNWR